MIDEATLAEWESDARSELSDYEPWDQAEKIGDGTKVRWVLSDPKVVAWEAAHGHDPRLKCYPEFGCQVIEVPGAKRIIALIDALRGRGTTDDQEDVNLFMVEAGCRIAAAEPMPVFAMHQLVHEDIPRMIAELRRRREAAAKTVVVSVTSPEVEAMLPFVAQTCACHVNAPSWEKHDVNPPCSTRRAAEAAYIAAHTDWMP